jgi:hypothetical protein
MRSFRDFIAYSQPSKSEVWRHAVLTAKRKVREEGAIASRKKNAPAST